MSGRTLPWWYDPDFCEEIDEKAWLDALFHEQGWLRFNAEGQVKRVDPEFMMVSTPSSRTNPFYQAWLGASVNTLLDDAPEEEE